MARKVFFSFHFELDSWRVAKVRNSGVISGLEKSPFYDKAVWEEIKRSRGVQPWIDEQMNGTSVTVVLLGAETGKRPWVKYEVAQSVSLAKGLLAIDISKIPDHRQSTTTLGPNPCPVGTSFYRWNNDDGRSNLSAWIEEAARSAGR